MGMTDLDEIGRLTIAEYNVLMKGFMLKELDRKHEIHLQAWTNARVNDTTEKGKLIYPEFNQFYDAEGAEEEILERKKSKKIEHYDKLVKIANNLREYRRINKLVEGGED